jgi:hypothetical protein
MHVDFIKLLQAVP